MMPKQVTLLLNDIILHTYISIMKPGLEDIVSGTEMIHEWMG